MRGVRNCLLSKGCAELSIVETSCKHDQWLEEIIEEYELLKKELKNKQKQLKKVTYRIVFDAYSFPDTCTSNNNYQVISYN